MIEETNTNVQERYHSRELHGRFDGFGCLHAVLHFSPGSSGSVKFFGNDKNVGQGILHFNVAPSGSLSSVCAELGSTLDGNFHQYTISMAGAGNTNVDKAARIVARHFSSVVDNTTAAALQLAVWEALYDGGATFGGASGNFQIVGPTAALADAQNFYSAIDTPGVARWYVSTEGGSQDQFAPVPEPASMAALGLGVLAAIKRRKSK